MGPHVLLQDGSIDYAEFVAMMRTREKDAHHEEDVDPHKDTATENAAGGAGVVGKRE